MRRTVVGLVFAGALLVAGVAGCSDDDPVATSDTTATTQATTASTGTTATTDTSTSGDGVAGPTQGFGSARLAIDRFFAAWQANDQVTARTVGVDKAVRDAFTQPGAGFALYGCDTGEFDTSTCNFRDRATGGYASITAEKAPIGWIVTGAALTIDN